MQRRKRLTWPQEPSPDDDDKRSMHTSPMKSFSFGPPKESGEQDGASDVSAGIGSNGSLDRIKEDFDSTPLTRATGYIGKNSEVTWMQRLKEQAKVGPPDRGWGSLEPDGTSQGGSMSRAQDRNKNSPPAPEGKEVPIHEATYHCDDLMLLSPDQVEPYELPPKQAADMLFHNYLETVHSTLPIIAKATFASQYQTLYQNDHVRPGDSWLAVLNLIFAIGAKYSHLIQAEWRGDERDHLVYFTRARILGMNGDSIFRHPDLQQVQVAALMAFYLLATDQINRYVSYLIPVCIVWWLTRPLLRAWTMSGIAVRYAITLGLNMENNTKGLSDRSKEVRYRVWWALYTVERMLAVMTGRPVCILDTDCNTPLPVPVDEDSFPGDSSGVLYANARHQFLRRVSSQGSRSPEHEASPASSGHSSRIKTSPTSSTSPRSQQSAFDSSKDIPPSRSLFFLHHTQLSTLTNVVLTRLYRAGTMSRSWADVQRTILSLDQSLEKWRAKLPSLFDFTKKQRDQQFICERMSLALSYYGTKIIINRPCLCRVDRQIPNESDHCRDLNQSVATACVHAAKSMLDLLPEQPNPIGLYKVSPWWSLLHSLMQAVTVLMLELSFRADHMPDDAEEILSSAKKAAQWLHKMSEDNIAARRAWALCSDMLRNVAPKVGSTADDLPRDPPSLEDHSNSDPQNSYPSLAMQDGGPWGGMQQFADDFPDQLLYGDPQSEKPIVFNAAMYTPYDEYLQRAGDLQPDGGSSAVPTTNVSSMFPTSSQMAQMDILDTMNPLSDGVNMPDFFLDSAQYWDTNKGPR